MKNLELLIDGHHGIYIPQMFAWMYWSYVDPESLSDSDELREILLAGPDHEYYWEAWEEVVSNVRLIADGCVWILYQEFGDLFAVPEDETEGLYDSGV